MLLALAVATPVGAAAPSIDDMAWHNRVLLMSAGSDADAQLLAQRRLTAAWPGAAERDIAVVQIVGDRVHGAADEAARLRSRFELPAAAFMVVLIGKDGHVALRSSQPLSAAVLAKTIDAMPMRKAETASRR